MITYPVCFNLRAFREHAKSISSASSWEAATKYLRQRGAPQRCHDFLGGPSPVKKLEHIGDHTFSLGMLLVLGGSWHFLRTQNWDYTPLEAAVTYAKPIRQTVSRVASPVTSGC